MTISEGYPDWQRVDTRAFKPFLDVTVDTGGSQYTSSKFFVGNFPTLIVQLLAAGTSYYTIGINWFSAETDTTPILTYDLILANGMGYQVGHSILAPWVEIVISPLTYTATNTVTVILTPTSNSTPMPQMVDTYLIQETERLIAAGGSLTVGAIYVTPGPGILMLYAGASTLYVLIVEVLMPSGLWTKIFTINATASGVSYDYQIVIPPKPVRVTVTNNDAAAHTYTFSLALWQ